MLLRKSALIWFALPHADERVGMLSIMISFLALKRQGFKGYILSSRGAWAH